MEVEIEDKASTLAMMKYMYGCLMIRLEQEDEGRICSKKGKKKYKRLTKIKKKDKREVGAYGRV